MPRLEIDTVGIDKARADLRAVLRRVKDLRPVLAQFGVHLVRSVEQTFQAGGRPVPWPPSVRALRTGGKTLIKTARLKNSIVSRVLDEQTVAIGTNVKYAAVHQLGFSGTVQVPAHLRVLRKGARRRAKRLEKTIGLAGIRDLLAGGFQGRGGTAGFTIVRAHPMHMRIPARPFLAVQPEDLETWSAMLSRHLEPGP